MANYCVNCGVRYTARKHHCVQRKTCRECGQEKPITAFSVHQSSWDGHKHSCIVCYEAIKQQKKARQGEYSIQTQQQNEQRAQENRLFQAYGYYWKKEVVTIGMDDEWEQEERFVLYDARGKPISPEDALHEITQLHQHYPDHPVTSWAKEILSLPNVVTLDTETTGLGQNDEIIEIAIWDIHAQHPYVTLVQCEQPTIPKSAEEMHHISKSMLLNAPTWPQIWPKLMKYLSRRVTLIYNADYDLRMLRQTAQRYDLPMPELQVHCLMKQYSSYVGRASSYGDGYRFFSLAAACAHFQIEQPYAHRALADAQAAASVLQKLATLAEVATINRTMEITNDHLTVKDDSVEIDD